MTHRVSRAAYYLGRETVFTDRQPSRPYGLVMSTRDLRAFGLTPESFHVAEPPKGDDGLGRLFRRLVIGQALASLVLGTCIAGAWGSPNPRPYSQQVAFSLRLVKLSD